MLSLSAIFVYGAQQSRSSTIDLNSDVVYPDIVSSYRIINNPLYVGIQSPFGLVQTFSRASPDLLDYRSPRKQILGSSTSESAIASLWQSVQTLGPG